MCFKNKDKENFSDIVKLKTFMVADIYHQKYVRESLSNRRKMKPGRNVDLSTEIRSIGSGSYVIYYMSIIPK